MQAQAQTLNIVLLEFKTLGIALFSSRERFTVIELTRQKLNYRLGENYCGYYLMTTLTLG